MFWKTKVIQIHIWEYEWTSKIGSSGNTLLNDEVKIGNKNSWYTVTILLEVAKAKSFYISSELGISKGQLISKCLLGIFKLTDLSRARHEWKCFNAYLKFKIIVLTKSLINGACISVVFDSILSKVIDIPSKFYFLHLKGVLLY